MKEGYYWVRVDATTEWEVAYLKDKTWYFNGDGFIHSDEYIKDIEVEIGDYIEMPGKYKENATGPVITKTCEWRGTTSPDILGREVIVTYDTECGHHAAMSMLLSSLLNHDYKCPICNRKIHFVEEKEKGE